MPFCATSDKNIFENGNIRPCLMYRGVRSRGAQCAYAPPCFKTGGAYAPPESMPP